MCLFCTDDDESQHVLNIFPILSDAAAGQKRQADIRRRHTLMFLGLFWFF